MNKKSFINLFLILFWILFVLIGYYYYHKPINVQMVAAPLNGFIDILFVILFSGLAGGLGRRALPAEEVPALERAVLQFALGAGLLSLLWLGFGALGFYRLPLGLIVLLIGLSALFRDVRGWFHLFNGVRDIWKGSGRFERFLGAFCGIMLLYQLFIALAPPVMWDALTYHLQLPRQFLDAGSLVFIPYNFYWGHPLLVEMLYTFAMSFHGAGAAAVTGWGAGVLFLVGLFSFTNTQLSRIQGKAVPNFSAGWMAVTAVMVGETFRRMLSWSYTDIFSALYGLAALTAFFTFLDTKKDRWFLWTGLFAGFAIGTKLTSGVLILGLVIVLLRYWHALNFSWRTGVLGGLLAFLVTLPWFIKNLVVTGSPLYPYLFPTPWLDAARMASANEPPPDLVLWQQLLLPFSTTWAGVGGAPGFGADLGPLLLLFALPGFWLVRCSPKTRMLALLLLPAALAMGTASYRFGHLIQTRLYFVLLPAVAAVCGWGWHELRKVTIEGVRLARIFSAVVIMALGLVLWQETYAFAGTSPADVFIGQQSNMSYLERTTGYYIRAMQAVNELPEDSHTLFLWEPRGYYAPLNAQADLWIDRWRTDRRELGDADAILRQWQAEGFTHLLVYQLGVEFMQSQAGEQPSENLKVWQEMEQRLSTPLVIRGSYFLYELK